MTPEGFKQLADYVRDVRKKKGLSQADVAKRGGPSAGWVGGLEAGTLTTIPKRETLFKLARALGVPAGDVLQIAGMQISYSFMDWIESTITKHGFKAAAGVISKDPGKRAALGQANHILRQMSDRERATDIYGRYVLAVEKLAEYIDGIIAIEEVNEFELIDSLHPAPKLSKVPVYYVKDEFPIDWLDRRPDTYVYIDTILFSSVAVALEMQHGKYTKEWGFRPGDYIYLSTDKAPEYEADTLLVEKDGEVLYAEYFNDNVGEYLQVVLPVNDKRRFVLDEVNIIAKVVAEVRNRSFCF